MPVRSSSPASRFFSSRRSNLSGKLRLGAAAALLGSSCSLVYDLSPDQCGNNSECARFGANFVCEEGICVDRSPSSGGKGGRASGGDGGTGNDTGTGGTMGGRDNASGAGGDGGEDSGGSPATGGTGGTDATGGTSGSAGDGGMGNAPGGCTTHNDCFLEFGESEPWACIDGECQALLNSDCEVVLPFDDTYNALRSTNAIIIGAFSNLNNGIPNPQLENFDLALFEINQETGGLVGSGNKRRQVVAVVCTSAYSAQVELEPRVDHLVETLKAPAILATLGVADQQYVYEHLLDRGADVFMMVPNSSDDDIVSLPDDGLIYHMLAGPDSLSQTYQPLIDMVITHLQNRGLLGTAPDYEEVRIALVTNTGNRFLTDLGDHFEGRVRWNGRDADGNRDASPSAFVSVGTISQPTTAQVTQTVDAILAIKPHIIVSAAGAEMTVSILPLIESRWEDEVGGQSKPFYVLSPSNYGAPVNDDLHGARLRTLGLGWPATLDSDEYKDYKSAYLQRYSKGTNYDLENFYDSVYFLVHGMAAAGAQIRGATIATGMTRITDPSGMTFSVGAKHVASSINFISGDIRRKIDLIGANGRPQWDLGGGRQTPASVWCINQGKAYVPDVLTYDKDGGTLSGTISSQVCFTFPAPAP